MANEQSGGFPIEDNVINNNNIATRNSTLISLSPIVIGPPIVHSIMINNPSSSHQIVGAIQLSNLAESDFIEFGSITLILQEALYERWANNGFRGEGVIDLGERRVGITNGHIASITNLGLRPGEEFSIGIVFNLKRDLEISSKKPSFSYDLNHVYANGTTGSAFIFNLIGQDEKTKERTKLPLKGNLNNNITILELSPNPTAGDLTIKYNIPTDAENSKLMIVDMQGKIIMETKIDCIGMCSNTFTIPKELSNGTYFCALYINNKLVETRKVSLVK